MGYWPDVNPGDTFQPNAKLENEIRHRLNELNGFGGGAIQAGNPGLIRVPVYNATSPAAVLPAGKAVSINLTGTIAGDAYPAIAFSDSLPCYGVLLKDLKAGDCGTCVLSGLASVEIASTPATGNYALPGTGGVFERGDEGVPILNVSGGTSAVVMLGALKTFGGGVDYDAGPGINSDLLSGGTISGNYIGVGNVTVSPVEGSTNGQMKIECSGGGGGDVPPGTIIAYAGPLNYMPGESYDDQYFPEGYNGQGNIPVGWLHCHGQAVSRTVYAALFAAIGTVYGSGDGSTTFNVPDFRGSFLRGAGNSSPHDVLGYAVIEDEENPGEYIDAGLIEIIGREIESGEAVISGQTVNLAGALITTSGLMINGTNVEYRNMTLAGVLEVSGVGYISDFAPISDRSGEYQYEMGMHLYQELPNMLGSFWGITLGPDPDGGTPYIPNPGPFINHDGTFGQGIMPFPITQNPYHSPYVTGLMITTEHIPDDPTFYNVQIFGSTTGDYSYKTNVSVTRYDFNAYQGQLLGMGNNVYTVGDYIREYGTNPPDATLTIKNNATSEGYNLPTRHIVHWLIKY